MATTALIKTLCWYVFVFLRLSSNRNVEKRIPYYSINVAHHESRIFQVMVINFGAPDLIPIDFLLRGTYGPHQLRTKAQGLMPKIHRPSLMLFPIQTAHSCFLKPHLPNQEKNI